MAYQKLNPFIDSKQMTQAEFNLFTEHVCQMRRKRMTLKEIADELGVTVQRVHHAYSKAMKAVPPLQANALRQEMIDQLDRLEAKALVVLDAFHFVTNLRGVVTVKDIHGAQVPLEDHGPALAAIDAVLKIQQRKAKLLGLDAPVKVAATVHEVSEEDVAIAELIRDQEAKNALERAETRETTDG